MDNITYKLRIADRLLSKRLLSAGAVLIKGLKWCGKTTTAMQVAGSSVMLANPNTLRQSRMMAENDMSILLAGDTPRLFDEWQSIPDLWDSIRDERRHVGRSHRLFERLKSYV